MLDNYGISYEYRFTIWPLKGSKLWRSTALKSILTDIPETMLVLTEGEYQEIQKELREIGFEMIKVQRRIHNEYENIHSTSSSSDTQRLHP